MIKHLKMKEIEQEELDKWHSIEVNYPTLYIITFVVLLIHLIYRHKVLKIRFYRI